MSVRVAAIFIILTLLAGSARAVDKQRARDAYHDGLQHYNLAEYKEALESFKEAYRNFEDPSFLFNIGQCHRQLNDPAQAIRFFKTYLREVPDAANREEVKKLITSLEEEMQHAQASKASPPQGTLAPGESAPTAPRAATTVLSPAPAPAIAPAALSANATASKPERPLVRKPWLWAAVAVGAVAIGLGVGLGVGLGLPPKDPTPSLGAVTKN